MDGRNLEVEQRLIMSGLKKGSDPDVFVPNPAPVNLARCTSRFLGPHNESLKGELITIAGASDHLQLSEPLPQNGGIPGLWWVGSARRVACDNPGDARS
jgi:hypothetical protein